MTEMLPNIGSACKGGRLLLTMLGGLILVGCSNRPPQVVADRPLIEHVNSVRYIPLPNALHMAIEKLSMGQQLRVTASPGRSVLMAAESEYISALGHPCKQLTLQLETERRKRITCLVQNEWKLVPNVLTDVDAGLNHDWLP